MRISDWSSDVCSSDLIRALCDRATILRGGRVVAECDPRAETARSLAQMMIGTELKTVVRRSEEHTSELQSLMRISYAVFCLKKKNHKRKIQTHHNCNPETTYNDE